MARRMSKADKMEPAVRISRVCFACKSSFVLSHPNSPKMLCDECQETLGKMIMERRADEQQETGNSVREQDVLATSI